MRQFDSSDGITKDKKWKVIDEVERYKIKDAFERKVQTKRDKQKY